MVFETEFISIGAFGARPEVFRAISRRNELLDEACAGITAECLLKSAQLLLVDRQFPTHQAAPSLRARDFEPAVEPVREAVSGLTEANLIARVEQLADKLASISGLVRSKRGDRDSARPLSAASKFVWTGAPDMGIIYDRWSAAALRKLGRDVGAGDYRAFVEAHRQEAPNHEGELSEALTRLANMHPGLAIHSWTKAKIFELWLYAIGKPKL